MNPEVYSTLCLRQNLQSGLPLSIRPFNTKLITDPNMLNNITETIIQALRILAAEIYLGISFIHRFGIVHQDVKPENLMVSRDGHIVLSNFATARMLPVVELRDLSSPTKMKRTFGKIKMLDTVINLTPIYAAPELMKTRLDASLEYDERVDWWSLGVTLYAIATGQLFFEKEDNLPACIEELLGEQSDHRKQNGNGFWDFLGLLLVRDPELRMCGKQVKLHPFFDPLIGIWGNIESLRHTPPCPHPPKLAHFYSAGQTPSSNDFELPNSYEFGNVTIYQEIPNAETWSDASETHKNMTSPHISSAWGLHRPFENVLNNSSEPDHLNCGNDFGAIEQRNLLDSFLVPNAINQSIGEGHSICSAKPWLYTASPARICNDGTKRYPQTDFGDMEFETGSGKVEGDFNDSGLHLPLETFPKTLGPSKETDLQLYTRLDHYSHSKGNMKPQINNPTQHKHCTSELGATWSFEEQLAISLLSAGTTSPNNNGNASAVLQKRGTTMQLFIGISRKIVKAVRKKISQIFQQ
ncbi:Calcium-independent protein kinase C [Psilocybe cubensis]|nr:Calcium-independent protein kinase C [Psilocybe cubensis]KAH9480559.1 Calcium-independent protein kinase C [Psilocybe cubensis]